MGVKLNRSDLAAYLGVSLPTIDRMVKEGMPVVQRGGRGIEWVFDSADVTRWQAERRVQQLMGDGPSALDEIERRTAQAKMVTAELEAAKARQEVALIGEFERAQARAMAEIQANVMNVPARAVLQLLGETNETVFKTKLKAELTLALEAAANAALSLDDENEEDPEAAGD